MIYFKKLALIIFVFSLVAVSFASFSKARGVPVYSPQNPQSPDIYLPIIFNPGPPPSVFGVETNWIDQNLLDKAGGIQTYWWRYSAFLWDRIEPVDMDPAQYLWTTAVQEANLNAATQQGFSIVAVVKNTPFFAQKYIDPQGRHIPCSAIKNDSYTIGEFTEFIHALAVRYSAPPYNIRYWQLGNEPDIDPKVFPLEDRPTTVFGCWGDDSDQYYGGRYYADFLQIFSQTIKAVNPSAKITNGGLLLDCHPVNDAPNCLPGTFFEGIIKRLQQNNALSALDYVSFHAYARWYGTLRFDEEWKGFTPHGGTLLGKSYFLREVMINNGVTPLKPLLVTEGGTMCAASSSTVFPSGFRCTDPTPPTEFSDDQAEHIIRNYVRTISDGISGFMWYTLNYQPYRHVGLLFGDNTPKPAYTAYQFLVSQLGDAQYVAPLNQFFPTLRAYEFSKNSQRIWVLWASDQLDHSILMPSGFQAAYDKLGSLINVPPGATTLTINSPVYLILD